MPLLLFAWPDEQAERNRWELGVPLLGSLILTHDVDGTVRGLKEWPPEDRPPVALPFFSFRLMVGIGLVMLAIAVAGLALWRRGRLATSRRFHAVLEDTNDIAFSAVEVKDGFGAEPGIWFRLGLGGITGHRDFAKYGDIIVKPADATRVSDAIVRVFIDLGDRTNRNKARLKYVLDGMGHEKFLGLVEERLGQPFTRVPPEALLPRPAFDRMAHIGVHKQKQEGLNWIGVSVPLGKVTCDQMRGLAKIAQDLGDGDIRLTVWQNLLIPGVADQNVELAIAAIEKIGLAVEASQIRAGLIACTGNAGCRFAASDTKRHAAEIGDWCEPRVNIETPLNIHVTGCHHSCAQHYISDIGLIAAKVDVGEDVDPVEGYHLFTGGGFGPDADVGQEVYHDLKAEDAPRTVERLLKAYLAHRSSPEETFLTFARRHDGETLRKLADAQVAEAQVSS